MYVCTTIYNTHTINFYILSFFICHQRKFIIQLEIKSIAHYGPLHYNITYHILSALVYGYVLKQDSAFLPYILYNRNNREQQRRIDCIRFEQVLFRFIVHEVFLTCLLMLIYIYVSIIRSSRPSYPKPTSIQICFLFMCEGKIRMIVPRNCCWKGEYNFKKYVLFLDVVNHMWKCNIVKTKCLEIFDCILYCKI